MYLNGKNPPLCLQVSSMAPSSRAEKVRRLCEVTASVLGRTEPRCGSAWKRALQARAKEQTVYGTTPLFAVCQHLTDPYPFVSNCQNFPDPLPLCHQSSVFLIPPPPLCSWYFCEGTHCRCLVTGHSCIVLPLILFCTLAPGWSPVGPSQEETLS